LIFALFITTLGVVYRYCFRSKILQDSSSFSHSLSDTLIYIMSILFQQGIAIFLTNELFLIANALPFINHKRKSFGSQQISTVKFSAGSRLVAPDDRCIGKSVHEHNYLLFDGCQIGTHCKHTRRVG